MESIVIKKLPLLILLIVFLFSCTPASKIHDSSTSIETSSNEVDIKPLSKPYAIIIFEETKASVEVQEIDNYSLAVNQFFISTITCLNDKGYGVVKGISKKGDLFEDKRELELVWNGRTRKGVDQKFDNLTLLIQSEISDLKIVSTVSRSFLGALAGNSRIDINLKMVDVSTGKLLKEQLLTSTNNSFAAAWVGGVNDRSLPDDMGRIVADYIAQVVKNPDKRNFLREE